MELRKNIDYVIKRDSLINKNVNKYIQQIPEKSNIDAFVAPEEKGKKTIMIFGYRKN